VYDTSDSLCLIVATLFLLGVATGVAAIAHRSRKARRVWRAVANRAEGRCETCGYDLRGSNERCPECGRAMGR
jgi:rubrerythrin